jgi:hypothetical protein
LAARLRYSRYLSLVGSLAHPDLRVANKARPRTTLAILLMHSAP